VLTIEKFEGEISLELHLKIQLVPRSKYNPSQL